MLQLCKFATFHACRFDIMRKLFVLLLSLGCLFRTMGQGTEPTGPVVKITGRIVDSVTLVPIQYATITLYKVNTAKPVGGMMTGGKGEFSIEAPRPGSYSLTIDCIGYGSRRIGPFPGEERKSALGDIQLGKKVTALESVTVSAQRGLVENKLDKIV
jgi:hypothetical protein